MNKATAHAIAKVWEIRPHAPQDRAWYPFIQALVGQFWDMTNTLVVIPTRKNPYESSSAMFRDIREGRLKVWTGGADLVPGHPLLGTIGRYKLNTMFRAVHDYFGHYQTSSPFETVTGEVRAYREHARLFPPVAHGVLFAETIGQLAYFVANGRFVPEQRAIVFPLSLVREFENRLEGEGAE